MSWLFGHWPADYHEPEHTPDDQSWGWLIALTVAVLAIVAGVLIGWPTAIVVTVVAALVLVLYLVRR